MRELHDGAGVWRRLAEMLGGRGVPSLEGALRELQLAPVHAAVRAAILDPSREAVERLVAAVADATGTSGDQGAVVERIMAAVTAAGPVAGSITDGSQQAALRVRTLLAPLGSLAEGAIAGPTSRAWYEELRLAPVVADGLRATGLDEGAAWWAAERVHTLLDLPLPSALGGPATTLPARLADAWLGNTAARSFLRVNEWQGTEWFHLESWMELLDWVDRLERVGATGGGAAGDGAASRGALIRRMRDAADASGYRVDELRAALTPPASSSRGKRAAGDKAVARDGEGTASVSRERNAREPQDLLAGRLRRSLAAREDRARADARRRAHRSMIPALGPSAMIVAGARLAPSIA